MDAEPLSRGCGDLFIKRGFKACGWNARMAFRIGADADLFNSDFAQAALLDHGEGIAKSARHVDISTDDQELTHIGFTAQAGEQTMQGVSTGDPASGDVGNRFKSGFSYGGCGRHKLTRILRRHRRKI